MKLTETWDYRPCLIGHPDNRNNPIVTANGKNIARLFSQAATVIGMTSLAPTSQEAESNAYLIAAAPDLYEAVKIALDETPWKPLGEDIKVILRAAMSKAEGKERKKE